MHARIKTFCLDFIPPFLLLYSCSQHIICSYRVRHAARVKSLLVAGRLVLTGLHRRGSYPWFDPLRVGTAVAAASQSAVQMQSAISWGENCLPRKQLLLSPCNYSPCNFFHLATCVCRYGTYTYLPGMHKKIFLFRSAWSWNYYIVFRTIWNDPWYSPIIFQTILA